MIRFRHAALAGAAALVTACASRPAMPVHVTPSAALDAAGDERTLLRARRANDSLQVVIASIAMLKAEDPDVRRLAQTIANDHMIAMSDASAHATTTTFRANLRRGAQAPVVARLTGMAPGPGFDAAFVDAVLAAHRRDAIERRRLLPRIGGAIRQLLDRTQPMLELHLRLAEALERVR